MPGHFSTPFRIGVDVGGTFTDLVLADAAGMLRVFKLPSVPEDPARGVMDAVDRAAKSLDLSVTSLLGECVHFMHGSTIATNTALEHKGAKVGLLTTQGFRDSLEIRRGMRDSPWEHRTPNPPVLVPRYLRLPVRERIDRNGVAIDALHIEDVDAAADLFRQEGVESIAICFLNSFANPSHERATQQALSNGWNEWISVSSAIAPLIGEYERASTTAMNAYVAPRAISYLRALNERLREHGFRHSILLIQNNGGAIYINHLAGNAVKLLLSGPAAAVGALDLYKEAIGSSNLISMEIGGTSCDVLLMRDGAVATTDQLQLGGYHLAVSSVDIHTIGAGGGTIAGVDSAGMLFAGPQGAGSRPGPAAYGFGGDRPTVTDAHLVLGRLRPGPYANGSVILDKRLAAEAIARHVAKPLGIDVPTAAAGILRLVEQKLLQAVQRISLERGYDPRGFVLVAAGGAGPMHGAAIGRMLKCARVYIPRLSGAFCALGMLQSNARVDYVKVHLSRLHSADLEKLDAIYDELGTQAVAFMREAGFERAAIQLAREVDLRYLGQQWDVRLPLTEDPLSRDAIKQAFEVEHERLFGHRQPDGVVEVTKLRVVGLGLLSPLQAARLDVKLDTPIPGERRPVFMDERVGWQEIDVYRGRDLVPGHRMKGPLLIEEDTTTVFIGVEEALEVDKTNNFVVHLR